MSDTFGVLETDFGATRTPLFNNYRSSPELIRIQHVLAQAPDAGAVEPVSKTKRTIDGDSCAIWDFSSPEKEALRLAIFVADQMKAHDLTPRDFALLVRQKAADYFDVLAPTFADRGLPLRNEAAFVGSVTVQDLLTEKVSDVLVRILRLATSDRAGIDWSECQQVLASLRGVNADEDAAQARLSRELDQFAREFGGAYSDPIRDEDGAQTVVAAVLDLVGRDRLIASNPAYRQGDWYGKVIEAATKHLWASAASAADWTATLNAYEGTHAVPLMTIHKSKGLEYHTVVFVGLDDGAWWSFANDQIEGTAAFFVAFSRAKQRVVFTYCASRGTRRKIATLYNLLQLAGVSAINVD